MYSLVVLCLLSAAVALPTPELLHTNSLAPPPPPGLKSEKKDIHSEVLYIDKPNPHLLDKNESEKAKNPLESAEKPKAKNDEGKVEPTDDMKIIQKESKESKEYKDSKEKSKESKDSKEKSKDSKDSKEKSKESKDSKEKSKESKDSKEVSWEYNKEKEEKKDSKSEELKERDEEEGSVIVQVINKPGQKGFIANWLGSHLPWPLSYFASKFRNSGQQPIYIVREADFIFDDDFDRN